MRYKREEGNSLESVCLYFEVIKDVIFQKQVINVGYIIGVDREFG